MAIIKGLQTLKNHEMALIWSMEQAMGTTLEMHTNPLHLYDVQMVPRSCEILPLIVWFWYPNLDLVWYPINELFISPFI